LLHRKIPAITSPPPRYIEQILKKPHRYIARFAQACSHVAIGLRSGDFGMTYHSTHTNQISVADQRQASPATPAFFKFAAHQND
jgi:hypothetical protein